MLTNCQFALLRLVAKKLARKLFYKCFYQASIFNDNKFNSILFYNHFTSHRLSIIVYDS